jgi:hypothetical protein
MRPTLLTGLIAIVAALGGVATPAHASRTVLAAKTTTCTTGADGSSRAAAFTGSMPAGVATHHMQMRFALYQRAGAGPKGTFKRIAVPAWGGWQKSDAGRDGFVFTKRVEALTAPAGYRAVIFFRWYDANGRVQRTTTRTTPVCEQPDPRPDLVLDAIDATSAGDESATYTVSVGNDGHVAAAPFTVTMAVTDGASTAVTLGPIAAGGRAEVTVNAGRCTPGSTIKIAVDATNAVDESAEGNNVVQRACPLS